MAYLAPPLKGGAKKEEANAINSKKLTHISEQVSKSHQKLDNISGQLISLHL